MLQLAKRPSEYTAVVVVIITITPTPTPVQKYCPSAFHQHNVITSCSDADKGPCLRSWPLWLKSWIPLLWTDMHVPWIYMTFGVSLHERIQGGPPCSQDFFKIMQFSRNFKGRTPILSKFWGSGPPLGQNSTGPPWPKSWIRACTSPHGCSRHVAIHSTRPCDRIKPYYAASEYSDWLNLNHAMWFLISEPPPCSKNCFQQRSVSQWLQWILFMILNHGSCVIICWDCDSCWWCCRVLKGAGSQSVVSVCQHTLVG